MAPSAGPGAYPGPPGYGSGPVAPHTDSKAIVGLILAIASYMLCPLILAIVALVLAGQSDREIAASRGWLEGGTINTATRWIAWINIALTVLLVVGLVVVMVVALSTGVTWEEPPQF